MNATVFQEVIIPSPREFALTWKSFFTVTSAIATYNANENGLQRFGELSVHASNLLNEAADSPEMSAIIEEMANDDKEKISLGILYEEMQYISWKYKDSLEIAGLEVPEYIYAMEEPVQFADQEGHPGDANAIGDVEIVTGSVKSILDKLPKWVRKIIDAIMEALKLTRGQID